VAFLCALCDALANFAVKSFFNRRGRKENPQRPQRKTDANAVFQRLNPDDSMIQFSVMNQCRN
jgi:hypothetical protein